MIPFKKGGKLEISEISPPNLVVIERCPYQNRTSFIKQVLFETFFRITNSCGNNCVERLK